MTNLDVSSLKFSSKDTFTDADFSKRQDHKILPDANVISVKVRDDDVREYAVRDPNGNLLKAIHLELTPGNAGDAVGQKLCQVCYTTESMEYRCVNVKCGGTVVVQTVEG